MQLSGSECKRLKLALLNAFPNTISLEQMLLHELDKNLREIAGEGSLQEIVFKLIQSANSQGWVEELIRAACNENPGNIKLKSIAEDLLPNSDAETSSVSSPSILITESQQQPQNLPSAPQSQTRFSFPGESFDKLPQPSSQEIPEPKPMEILPRDEFFVTVDEAPEGDCKFITHVANKYEQSQVTNFSNNSLVEDKKISNTYLPVNEVATVEILEMDSRTLQENLVNIQKSGTPEQCQEAIAKTSPWLKSHPDDSYVRRQYLILVREKGELEQRQEAILDTVIWLKDNLLCDSYVFTEYLKLVTKQGTLEQCQEASSQACIWLQNNPDEPYVRKQWLVLAKDKLKLEQCQEVISQTYSWLSDNLTTCDSYVMTEYLRLNKKAGASHQCQQAIIQAVSWLEKNPDNSYVHNQYVALVNKQA
ncbi:MAG: hypothetical protein KME29_09585 [Calothrix sp. FI2-JRJ7]|jgi:hypothetical protein|nr:hypothetical protein [Calothrix sp. FI2-JRJ7]